MRRRWRRVEFVGFPWGVGFFFLGVVVGMGGMGGVGGMDGMDGADGMDEMGGMGWNGMGSDSGHICLSCHFLYLSFLLCTVPVQYHMNSTHPPEWDIKCMFTTVHRHTYIHTYIHPTPNTTKF